mmetsp:Transcript_39639/g.112417  ORF Transcript_39639/g.112417 Transcript_39639/m.112417 type:complete len:95 (-) Transcript_39639:1640-1924(-)
MAACSKGLAALAKLPSSKSSAHACLPANPCSSPTLPICEKLHFNLSPSWMPDTAPLPSQPHPPAPVALPSARLRPCSHRTSGSWARQLPLSRPG